MKRTSEERRAFVDAAALQQIENPTPAEEAAWRLLEPLGFKRQVVIVGWTKNGGEWQYIADFAKLDTLDGQIISGLIVEVDGASHRNKRGRDRRRDGRLRAEGILTLRIPNAEVKKLTPDAMESKVVAFMGANW